MTASTCAAWSCVVLVLAWERAEVTLLSSSWASGYPGFERAVRALRGLAHVVGWLAALAWAIEGRLQ